MAMAEPCYPVLPDHVIEDILARLPAKTVLRCRCLSRAWAATLSTDDFADRHLRLANRHGSPRILIMQAALSRESLPKIHAWSPEHPACTTLMEFHGAVTRCNRGPLWPLVRRNGRNTDADNVVPLVVTMQCRGLVIVEAIGAGLHFVFNPSTGQMAALPEGRHIGFPIPDRRYASLGIGYDTISKKHKVVRVYYRGSDVDNLPASGAGCEVYVVNSGGLWRPANGGARERPPGWVKQDGKSVFAQGHVHWLARSKLNPPNKRETWAFIATFSLSDETFGTVQFPLNEHCNSVLGHYLTEMGGRLCLISWVLKKVEWSRPHLYYIWLLRRHETSTWDLHCIIDLDTSSPEVLRFMHARQFVSPLAMIDNGRRVVLVHVQPRHLQFDSAADFELCAYNPETGDMENLLDQSGLLSNQGMVIGQPTFYEESIAYPGQPHEDIIFAMSLVLRQMSKRTLTRLRFVCRSWRAMIESSDFLEKRRRVLMRSMCRF
ncbi:hypothetical protein CFC21_104261 [Triticum aestivum]|uniref:F-box domain-containing protein n=3 Tax=Triticum TaxID=4564 RepID=A0A9R1C3P5_TRITD|nr:putative F-box protein At1g33530 [Triticum aestivum]KAF7103251.1 hypothetical protein CFC21_104261 [Triticum aestivum]VAI91113.1 unnamed protein product [Triticum turgidum subsp. durum]